MAQPEPPQLASPRVGKKVLVDETGNRVKTKSPNLQRALVDTGLTLEDLRPKKEADLQKLERKPLPPPALQRRAKAVEEMRKQHFREVMLVREKYVAAQLAGEAAAKLRGDGTPEPPDVDAGVRANQRAMAEQLERDKERMQRAEAMALQEAQEVARAAQHADEMMRELERSKAAAAEAAKQKRAKHMQERLEREQRRQAEEEAARELMHMQQAELERYEERWSESFSQRHSSSSDNKHAHNRAHLQRVAERKAREKEREAQRAQHQLELEAKNQAHLNAHTARVERYHARIVKDKVRRGQEVEQKHQQAMDARREYQLSLIRQDEEQTAAFKARLEAVEAAHTAQEEADRKAGKLKAQKWERIRDQNKRDRAERDNQRFNAAEAKDERIDHVNEVQKTSMAVRAEESRLRRAKREDKVIRLQRQREAARKAKLVRASPASSCSALPCLALLLCIVHSMDALCLIVTLTIPRHATPQQEDLERQDKASAEARKAKARIQNNRGQMVRQFFVERKKMQEGQKQKMVSVVP
jgi:hypothetical protein